jgi:DHA1 family multidrug resistance protein-like MFS transporter
MRLPPRGGRAVAPREAEDAALRAQSWRFVLLLFLVVQIIETFGVGIISAFLPLYLRALGLPQADVARWVGLLTSSFFLLGLPLVPFWGVWADKYSRKAIIARSAYVEAVIYLLVALARTPLELAGALLLVGFQLGNSGVMLAVLRETVPAKRVGLAIAVQGTAGPLGFAVGPLVGGWLLDHTAIGLHGLFFLTAALSLASGLLLTLVLRESRTRPRPAGSVRRLALGAIGGVFTVRVTLWLFTIYALFILGRQMAIPFLPLFVERVYHQRGGLASAVGLVTGTSALLGTLLAPLAGAIGDRLGFRRVLVAALLLAALGLGLLRVASSVALLALFSALLGGAGAATVAMVFALLATTVPEERRSATLNLAYVPLYIGNIIGPALVAGISGFGLDTVALVAAAVTLAGALLAGPNPPICMPPPRFAHPMRDLPEAGRGRRG